MDVEFSFSDFSAEVPKEKRGGGGFYLSVDIANLHPFKTPLSIDESATPTWDFTKSLTHSVKAFEDLEGKDLNLRLHSSDGTIIGSTTIPLQAVVTGPVRYEMLLGEKADRPILEAAVSFTCSAKLMGTSQLRLTGLSATLEGAKAMTPIYVKNTYGAAGQQLAALTEDGRWEDLTLHVRCGLYDLVVLSEKGAHFHIHDEQNLKATGHLKFADIFDHLERPKPFAVPLVAVGGGVIGEVSGVATLSDLPALGQMWSGKMMFGSVVVGGYALTAHVPVPRGCKKRPPTYDRRSPPDGDASPAHDPLASVPLPPGWGLRVAEGTGRPFFAFHPTSTTTWTDPRFLPPDWEQKLDVNGQVHFYNLRSLQTTLVDPRGLPGGWEQRLTEKAEVYFAHAATKQTTFIDPRGLPLGWEMALDANGRPFFKNHEKRETAWEDPRQAKGVTDAERIAMKDSEFARWWMQQVKAHAKNRERME